MNRLYNDFGDEVGLFDVCEWFVDTYPDDIFIKEPSDIVTIRNCCQNIINMRKVKE